MKKLALASVSLLTLAAAAAALVVARLKIDPWRLGSVLAALSLLLGAFVALTNGEWVRELRLLAQRSPWIALSFSLTPLLPYAIFGLGTGTISARAALKLAAYVITPSLLLLPDRLQSAQVASWREFLALAALAIPIPAHWLTGIWAWPEELYFFLPLIAVCAGLCAFVVVRGLDDVGYSLAWRKQDVARGLTNFLAFVIIAVPLGYVMHFIRFHAHRVSPVEFVFQLLGVYLTIAIPEELLFRGVLQNLLTQDHPPWSAWAIRANHRVGHLWSLAFPPPAHAQLALLHHGHDCWASVRKCLPGTTPHLVPCADARAGRHDLAVLVLRMSQGQAATAFSVFVA